MEADAGRTFRAMARFRRIQSEHHGQCGDRRDQRHDCGQSTHAATNQPLIASIASNIDQIRARGAELAWQKDNVALDHLELFGSVTYVDARILSDPTFVSTIGTNAVGKRVPNVPEWRSTLGATYRPTEQWAFTAAGRYQSKTFSTLDNIDPNPNVF